MEFIKSQTQNEDLRTLTINTDMMDMMDKAIIKEANKEIRAKCNTKNSLFTFFYVR